MLLTLRSGGAAAETDQSPIGEVKLQGHDAVGAVGGYKACTRLSRIAKRWFDSWSSSHSVGCGDDVVMPSDRAVDLAAIPCVRSRG
jgi:hypothetical protein